MTPKKEKRCPKCQVVKSVADFYADRTTSDGLTCYCRICKAAANKTFAQKNQENALAYQRIWRQKRASQEKETPTDKQCTQCGVRKLACEFHSHPSAHDGLTAMCRTCKSTRAKAWQVKNRDKFRDYQKAWVAEHREQLNKAAQEYRDKDRTKARSIGLAHYRRNREKRLVSQKKTYRKHQQKRRAEGRAYYHVTRERHIANAKSWKQSHPEAVKMHVRKRRANEMGIPGSHTEAQWKALCVRFDNRCVRCGAIAKLTRDHVVPVSHPLSSDDISNIQPLCHPCNSGKRNLESVDYRMTPYIRTGQTVLFAA